MNQNNKSRFYLRIRIALLTGMVGAICAANGTDGDQAEIEKQKLYPGGWETYELHRRQFRVPNEQDDVGEGAVMELLIISEGRVELIIGDLARGTGKIYSGIGNASIAVEKYDQRVVAFPGELVRKSLVRIVSIQHDMVEAAEDKRMRTSNTTYYLSWRIPNSVCRAAFRSEQVRSAAAIDEIEKIANRFRK